MKIPPSGWSYRLRLGPAIQIGLCFHWLYLLFSRRQPLSRKLKLFFTVTSNTLDFFNFPPADGAKAELLPDTWFSSPEKQIWDRASLKSSEKTCEQYTTGNSRKGFDYRTLQTALAKRYNKALVLLVDLLNLPLYVRSLRQHPAEVKRFSCQCPLHKYTADRNCFMLAGATADRLEAFLWN